MKVILKADVKGQGKAGQLITVSDGYARNYLLPRNLAIPADNQAMQELKSKQDAAQHKIDLEKQTAQENAEKLNGKKVEIQAKGGSNGRLFGSVTTKEIASGIQNKFGINLDKRKIVLDEEIKAFGTYEIEIKLYPSVITKMNVQVIEQK